MKSALWSIFWRTFAQLATPALVVAAGVDWLSSDWRVRLVALGLSLLSAVVGAAVAVLWAASNQGPAITAMEKAIRSLLQSLAGGLSALVLSSVADLMSVPRLLIGIALTALGAFALTFFQNQGPVRVEPAAD